MLAENMELGKKYFCNYTAIGDPKDFPALEGTGLSTVTVSGIGQVIQKDNENRLCIVGDLKTRVNYVVKFDDMTQIEEVA